MDYHFADRDPASPEEAATILLSWMDETDRETILDLMEARWPKAWGDEPEDTMGINFSGMSIHFGLMRDVRNGWLLGHRDPTATPLVTYCAEKYGMKHPDDISGLIQTALHGKLADKPYDLNAKAKAMREHYVQRDMNPLTWGD